MESGGVAELAERLGVRPRVGMILGSGLGGLADGIDSRVVVPYGEIPGFPEPTVAGHAGRLVAGRLEGVPLVAFQGRFHAYEGHDAETLGLLPRTAAALGADTMIVTCAAGGVNPSFEPGALMLIEDHINLMARSPLVGPPRPGETRFPDMTEAYDPALREAAIRSARDAGVELSRGVYAAVLGPTYETPAEIRMLGRLGADAVGMSTVPEVATARALGLRVLGIALVTNLAAGLSEEHLDHEDVMRVAAQAAERMQAVVRGVVRGLAGDG